MPSVSLVILAWPPYQAKPMNVFTLLGSLSASKLADLEVVVVCNGNDPVLESKLRSDPRIDVLVTPGVNLGVAAGWKAAADVASGNVLIIANEDVVFTLET